MNKEEARKLVQASTHQIHNDCNNLGLLRYIFYDGLFGGHAYYSRNSVNNEPFISLKIIKLSEIEEEPKEWLGSDMDFWCEFERKWKPCLKLKYRLKPKSNFDLEIKALQEKAKQHGMNVNITFETI